ncbi:beta-ketoacyl-[acyl-carrier-protein] synthase family protein [Sinomonas mesophila]|uniref:beta-ketoacyl-[acyl-carrier-protein] synthase family protein n=1 Tax=Sinomonas mesophila TaxID=1531955 RepID=UPI001C37791D|nr:beta-ketoacyl-[acyl-carrier-protein] synthase family protein [Sinomonas mesophila]
MSAAVAVLPGGVPGAMPARPARRAVAVVALGAVTAHGTTAEDLWEGAGAGRVAISAVEHLPTEGYTTRLGGEVKAEVSASPVSGTVGGFRDRSFDFMFAAAGEASGKAAIAFDAVPPERRGLVLGTCNAGMLSALEWYREPSAHPRLPLYGPPQSMAESLAAHHGVRGPVLTVNTACAAGANALGLAADLVADGRADLVFAGGSDGLADLSYAGFNCLGSLSPRPAAPYAADRSGLSLGEGSGMMVLIASSLAAELGLEVLAEVRGYGLSADGFHPTAPHPEGLGAARAIRSALEQAGAAPEDVDYVNSHGTGTPKNDSAESRATVLAIPGARTDVPVSSTKSMVGHLLGAAGAVEAVVTVQALQHQTVPPTANMTAPDEDCALRHVPNAPEQRPLRLAVSNNFAFGGANASLVLGLPGAPSRPGPAGDIRVVVTGAGAVTAAGRGLGAVEEARRSPSAPRGLGGVPVRRVQAPEEHPYVSRRDSRRMDRLSTLSILAAGDALAEAGESLLAEPERVGVVFGTGIGPMEAMESFYRPVLADGASAANPGVYPNLVYNAAAGAVATHLRTLGPTSTVTTGHAAGATALAYAADLLRTHRADAIVATACDVLTASVARAYAGLGVPFRGGLALGEAAAAVVLETAESAQRRGAAASAELLSHATASDALGPGLWDPRGRGAERAMREALELAGLAPGDVAEVWAADCGWEEHDRPQREAVQRVLGPDARRESAWTAVGEPIGVGGLLRAALAARRLGARASGGAGTPASTRTSGGAVVVSASSWGGTHVCLVLAPL